MLTILCALYNIPGAPLCPSTMVAHADADIVTVTWQQPPNSPQVLSTMVTYYPSSASNCTSSTDCATNPCIISELGPSTTYNFITQSNNCGFISGCTGKNSTAETACKYVSDIVGVVTGVITLTYIYYNKIVWLGVGLYSAW